jgi:hypothetical protein
MSTSCERPPWPRSTRTDSPALDQPAPIAEQRAPVGADQGSDRLDDVRNLIVRGEVLDRDNQRRVAHDPWLAVVELGCDADQRAARDGSAAVTSSSLVMRSTVAPEDDSPRTQALN